MSRYFGFGQVGGEHWERPAAVPDGFGAGALGFGFNTELLAEKGLPEPKCWADLIKPESKEEEERLKREEEERKIREEEESRQAAERAEQEEEERKKREEEENKLKIKLEIEAQARAEEQQRMLSHEVEVKRLEAERKQVPKWLIAVIVLVVIGGTVGGIMYKISSDEEAAEKARIALEREETLRREFEEQKKSFGLKQVLFSSFGITLLILTLSSVGNNGINAQIANILPNVYGMDEQTTSALISLAGLFNIGLFIVAGRWMARSGGMTVLTGGTAIRFIGALGMALVGIMTTKPIILAAAFMLIMYQSNPFSRISQGVVGMRFATVPAGATSGWVIAAAAALLCAAPAARARSLGCHEATNGHAAAAAPATPTTAVEVVKNRRRRGSAC